MDKQYLKTTTSSLLCITVSLCSVQLFGQSISGRVLSAVDSLPIPGATILIEDLEPKSIKGGVSGSDGVFTLNVGKQDQISLAVSSVGFLTEQIQVKGFSENINIGDVFLEANNQILDEAVVTADNMIHKVDKSIIYPSEIQRKVSSSSLSLLQNLNLPGLYVDAIEQKFQQLQIPVEFVKIHNEADGNFPNGIPNHVLNVGCVL